MYTDFEDKKENLKSLKKGEGVQYILNEAYKIMGNPILMFDMDYKLLAYTETYSDDPIWAEFMTYGTLSAETLEMFKNESFILDVANAEMTTFLISDKLKYDRIFGKLYNKEHVPVADVVIVESDRPFSQGDQELLAIVCQSLSAELAKDDHYMRYGQNYLDLLFKKLIEQSIEDMGLYVAHVANIYDGLKSNLYLAVADIGLYDRERLRHIERFRALFKQTNDKFRYFVYSNYIVILCSTNCPRLDLENDLEKLLSIFHHNNIYVGVSRCFDNLFELHKHYNNAIAALDEGLKSTDGSFIFFYGE